MLKSYHTGLLAIILLESDLFQVATKSSREYRACGKERKSTGYKDCGLRKKVRPTEGSLSSERIEERTLKKLPTHLIRDERERKKKVIIFFSFADTRNNLPNDTNKRSGAVWCHSPLITTSPTSGLAKCEERSSKKS